MYRVCMVLEKVWVWYNMGLGMEGIYNECALGIRIGKKRIDGKKAYNSKEIKEGRKEGRREGRKEGRKEGKKEERKEETNERTNEQTNERPNK